MLSTATEAHRIDDLQVNGGKIFPAWDWRQAILAYLGSVWSGRAENSPGCPRIVFTDYWDNHVSLRLDLGANRYAAWGRTIGEPSFEFGSAETLQVRASSRAEVEQGLIRFVRDDRIRELVIAFTDERLVLRSSPQIRLYKTEKRAELRISASGIPDNV